MRRASNHRTVSRRASIQAPPTNSPRGSFDAPCEFAECATSIVEPAPADVSLSAAGTLANGSVISSDTDLDRHRYLVIAIRQRIESRLPGRVRNLVIRILAETVVLEGQCATYYTKQLAQHAAMGVLEDEHLENAIAVSVPR